MVCHLNWLYLFDEIIIQASIEAHRIVSMCFSVVFIRWIVGDQKWCIHTVTLGVGSSPVLLQCVHVWCVKAPGTLRAPEGAEFSHGGVAVGRDLCSPQPIRQQTHTDVFPRPLVLFI